ncbi:MAG TPA: alpha-1,4-glucan--maltose-1-phosphate maltosyltransferase [Chitinispirillaceae bacterium]|nr:alpha-1,4-glucan--maltose-1-phosphate maltosyltransferase [Chitinispirillaceae bacterium]
MEQDGRKRIVIENVKPAVGAGFAVKRIEGEMFKVSADLFCDSHDSIGGDVLYKKSSDSQWSSSHLHMVDNDRWECSFHLAEAGTYLYTVRAWVDHFQSWQHNLVKKFGAAQNIHMELQIGAQLLLAAIDRVPLPLSSSLQTRAELLLQEIDPARAVLLATDKEITAVLRAYPDLSLSQIFPNEYKVVVERKKALFSTWYEVFPRSCSSREGTSGTFRDCERRLPLIAQMGFDVLYLPPVHPIGMTNRKGKNNSLITEQADPGSPWAIGSDLGGHKAIEPSLGTIEDFIDLINAATSYGIEIAMDIAFQCSPDHPYIKEHPQWFKTRPDGTIQFAENPPKKYQDIVPFDFETDDWKELWDELKSIVFFWLDKGVRIFRVDNPHTKPFSFWQWLIAQVREKYPDVIFLSEAFTRPKIMYRLAKLGFSQSYTYFTWRDTKWELTEYFEQLSNSQLSDFFRPCLWPTTPDILPQYLQFGDERAFGVRLVLAATLSSSYGIYGPSFEQAVNQAPPGKEEFSNSEKYEIKHWDWIKGERLQKLITIMNNIRQQNPALQDFKNVKFFPVDNEFLLFYIKSTDDMSNVIMVVVNLDPFHSQSGKLHIPLSFLNIKPGQPYLLEDQIGKDRFIWSGAENSITVDPLSTPAFVFKIYRQFHKETMFDYY